MIFLIGPTAVGKSEVAIELALKMEGEIVSADSMQIYRGMDIGTSKPGPEERYGVPHHLLDMLDINQAFDVARFRKLALSTIADIRARGGQPIVVGGSGMYVRALTQGIFEGPGRDEKLREKLEDMGTPALRQRLMEADAAAASRIGTNDRRRMIRALEFFITTQTPISSRQTQWKKGKTTLYGKVRLIGLNRPREELYQRCEIRVDRMFSKGWVEEVRGLLKNGLAQSPTARKAIGYPEVIRYLSGELPLDQTVKLVKQRTRNFVKRQLTWFRSEPGITWLNLSGQELASAIASKIQALLNSA